METTSPGTTESGATVTTQLALLVPSFDPAKDDLLIYQQKVELLTATWPEGKLIELATRLVLNTSGTAFQKLQLNQSQILVNNKSGIRKIIELLGGAWGQIPLEKKFEAAERAIFRCQQRNDEANDSYLARADVLWQELLSKGTKIEELQAYIVLRGSLLSAEDKKRVVLLWWPVAIIKVITLVSCLLWERTYNWVVSSTTITYNWFAGLTSNHL